MGEENKVAPAPAAPAPAAPAPANGGGKGGSKVVIIIVIVVVVLGIIGYAAERYIAKKIADKAASTIISSATGGKVSVDSSGNGGVSVNSNGDSISSGSKAVWPVNMPSSVPKFTYGTISYSSSSDTADYKAWSAMFTDVTTDAGTKYANALTANGYAQTEVINNNDVSITTYENDTYRVSVTIDTSNKEATVSVGLK